MPPKTPKPHLITAKPNPKDKAKPEARYITASSAQEAVDKARDMGLTDVKLITTGFDARMPARRASDPTRGANSGRPSGSSRACGLRPRFATLPLCHFATSPLCPATPLELYLLSIRSAYRTLWFIPAIALAIVVIHLALGRPPGWVEAVALLIAAVPFGIVLITHLAPHPGSRPGGRPGSPDWPELKKAIHAADWGRVLELTERTSADDPTQPELTVELTKWRARALAARGDVREAERLVAGLPIGEALRAYILGTVYDTARDYAAAVRAYEDALHADPDFAEAWLSLSVALALRLRDPDGAQAALEHALTLPIAEPMQPIVDISRGLIALEQDRPSLALDHLEQAESALSIPDDPLLDLLLAPVHAALTLACTALNNPDQASKHLQTARPTLERHDPPLLKRCEEAMANGT